MRPELIGRPMRNISLEVGMMLRRSARTGGVLSTLLFLFLAIITASIVGGLYIARNVRVKTTHRHGGDDVSIETPGGRISIRAHEDLDPALVGIPIYPGSTRRKDSGVATFEWASADGNVEKGVSFAAAGLYTPDPSSKVLEYYRTQLPGWVVVTERDGSTRFEFRKGGYKRMIAIHEKNDGTHIGIASAGEPASN
jgi:hypothetical protein